MTKKELLLASELLKMAADEFGNHGCNDFDLFDYGFTENECKQYAKEYHEWNGDPEEYELTLEEKNYHYNYESDFAVMDYMAHKLRKLAEEMK